MKMTNSRSRPLEWKSNPDKTLYTSCVSITSTIEGKMVLSIPFIKFSIKKFSEVYFLEYELWDRKTSCSYANVAGAMQAAQHFCHGFIINSSISCADFDKSELLTPEEYAYFQVKHTIYPNKDDENKTCKIYLYTDKEEAINKAKQLKTVETPECVSSIFIVCNEDCAWVNPDGEISTQVGLSWK